MKLLFDQNLSPRLVTQLNDLFPDSKHLQDVSLDKAPDWDVCVYTKENNFIIVSKDIDFINIHSIKGFPPKIISLQKGNCSTQEIFDIITNHFEMINTFGKTSDHGVLILK